MARENGAKFRRLRMARTIAQVAAWVCMGLYSEVSGPTLPYLRQRVDSNYEEISRALVARSVGFLSGAVMGGVLCDRFYGLTDLWMSISLFLAAVAVAAAPWCTSLILLCVMFLLDGIGKGILASGGNSLIIKLWGKNAAPPTHAIHFSFGVGALIVPQIARLFLPDTHHSDLQATTTGPTTTSPYSVQSSTNLTVGVQTTDAPIDAPIEYPFAIVGGITALVGLAELVIFFCRGDTLRQDNPKKTKGGKCSKLTNWMHGPNRCLHITFILLLCMFWALPIGAERAYGKFIFTYTVEGPPKMATKDGTVVETLFWATFTAGRGAAILISKFCPPLIMLVVDLGLNVLAAAFLATLAGSSETVLWIFNCIFGSVLSPLFPACLAWANFYVKMTAMMTALAFIASAAGAFIFSWLSGYLFEYTGKQSLMYLILGYAVTVSLVFVVLYMVGRRKGKRNLHEDERNQEPAEHWEEEKFRTINS